ncbi:hypothetical protein D3C72_514050 [compost metagenome]
MRLIALVDFSWAHRGCIVEAFQKGQEIETEDPELIRVSLEEGWAEDGDARERAEEARQWEAEERARLELEAKAEADRLAKEEADRAAEADRLAKEEAARTAAAATQQPDAQEQLDMATAEQQAPADEKADKPAQNKARKGAPETK